MKFFIAVTDNNWYKYLASIKPDEVNFWRPTNIGFKAIDIGCPFLFKLHSPLNFITGGGFFIKTESLPLSIAWKVFGEKNGANDFYTFKKMIQSKRKDNNHDPFITCIILNEPFWFSQNNWIPEPEDWKSNIMTGKSYKTEDMIGARIWEQVQQNLLDKTPIKSNLKISEPTERYGQEYLTKSRIGQGAFRILVTSAYNKSCSITSERTLPVLEASHIKPFSESGPNSVSNGILLRADLHILFDRGYLTVTPNHYVEVSKSIKEEFDNGKEYYKLHGKPLQILPSEQINQPDEDYLRWHNEKVFIG